MSAAADGPIDQPRRWIASGLLLFLVALAVRALPYPLVFQEGVLIPEAGADDFYHLRRVEVGVEQFPRVLDFDHYTNHPDGGQIVWPPLWDFSMAAVARLVAGSGDRARMESVVAWIPPIVGALAVLTVAWIAARTFSPIAGLAAGVMLTWMPAHYLPSRLGKIDHHVAVGWLSALLMLAGMRALRRGPEAPRAALDAVLLGTAMSALLLVWTGGLLHIVVVEASMLAFLLASAERERARGWARQLAIAHGTALLLLLPFTAGRSWLEWSDVSPLVLSRFHPLYFGAATICLATLALAWRSDRFGGRVVRATSAIALATLGAAAVFWLEPELADALGFSAGWFENREDFHGHVMELRPLFLATGGFRVDVPVFTFTVLFLFVPLMALGLVWRTVRGIDPPETWLLVAWLVSFVAAACLQFRFTNSAALPFAVGSGFFVDRMLSRLRGWERSAVVALVVLSLLPTWGRFFADPVRDFAKARAGEPVRRGGVDRDNLDLVPVGHWLRDHTPQTASFLDPRFPPEYGVLAPWGWGHVLRYLSRRPMVQDNFGVYGGRRSYELSEAYFAAESEDEADAILEALGTRYVIAMPNGSGHGGSYGPASMTRRLGLVRGAQLRAGERVLPELTRHRLLHEHPLSIAAGRDATTRAINTLRIWERVAGARIEGTAEPGAFVTARARMGLADGSEFTWRSRRQASPDGRYELRIPYPSERFSPSVEPAASIQLGTARRIATLQLSEAAVRAGARVPGPSLGCEEDCAAEAAP